MYGGISEPAEMLAHTQVWQMRASKIDLYENPCSVTGTGKSANP
jgi:hypothetical protein